MGKQYRVTGTDERTGGVAVVVVEASSVGEAERLAASRGVRARRVEEQDASSGAASAGAATERAGGESEVWRGGSSQWVNFPLFLLCLLVIPIPYVAWRVLWTRMERFTLTSERLLHERGVLSRSVDETELYRVRDVTAKQSFWQRVVGVGDVGLVTSDRTDPDMVLRSVKDHRAVMDLIRAHTETMRKVKRVRELDVE